MRTRPRPAWRRGRHLGARAGSGRLAWTRGVPGRPAARLVHHPSAARLRPGRRPPQLRASSAPGRGPPCASLALASPVGSGAWRPLLSQGRGWTAPVQGALDEDTSAGRGPASSLGLWWRVGAPGPWAVQAPRPACCPPIIRRHCPAPVGQPGSSMTGPRAGPWPRGASGGKGGRRSGPGVSLPLHLSWRLTRRSPTGPSAPSQFHHKYPGRASGAELIVQPAAGPPEALPAVGAAAWAGKDPAAALHRLLPGRRGLNLGTHWSPA